MAEPFLAALFGVLSLGFFRVSVLFGFILRVPFQRRRFLLDAAILFALVYYLHWLGIRCLARRAYGTCSQVRGNLGLQC
jgi:hypothetical protein